MSTTNLRKLLLLGLLKDSDMHGYHLNAHLESNIPIQIKKPTSYNLLTRMEEDNWIVHKSEFTGNRERKVYSLTAKGKEVFKKMLKEELSTFSFPEYPGLVGIGLINEVPSSTKIKLLESRRKSLLEYIDIFSEQTQDGERETNHHDGSSILVLKYIRRSLNLELELLDELIIYNAK